MSLSLRKVFVMTAGLALLLVAAVGPALADTVVYDTEAAFQPVLSPGNYLEEFSLGSYTTPYAFSGGDGYAYTVTAPGGSLIVPAGLGALATDSQTLLFTFTGDTYPGDTVRAVGGKFFATDNSGAFISESVTVALTLADGTTSTFTWTPSTIDAFRGFWTALPIKSLEVETSAGFHPTVDHLYVDMDAVRAPRVPEPNEAVRLVGLACMALVALVWRRRSLRPRK